MKYEGSGFMFVVDLLLDGFFWVFELIEFDRLYCWVEGVMVVGNVYIDCGLVFKEGVDIE